MTVKTQSLGNDGKLSESEARRALMDIDEILYAPSKDQLAFMGKNRPRILRKTPYWERPELRGRFHRNPYQSRKAPITLGTGIKRLWGDLYYLLVCLMAPHPLAAFLYLGLLALAIHKLIGVLS